MSFRSMLNQRMIILRWTTTSQDTYGQFRGAHSNFATNVPCRVAHSSGQEFYRDTKLITSTHVIFTATSIEIFERDILSVYNETSFDVLFVARRSDRKLLGSDEFDSPILGKIHHYEISCRQVKLQGEVGRTDT